MDIFGTNPNNSINDGTFTDSTLTGSTTIVTQNGSTYNLETPDNGNSLDVLSTDGVGNTYWAPSGGGGGSQTLQQVYDASATPAICTLVYGKNIEFQTEDSDNLLKIDATSSTNYGISAERAYVNFLNSTISTSNSFIKTGGSSNQYLMADGSSLQYSQNSGNSNFYLYDSQNGVGSPPISNGHIEYNTNTQANATIIYISHLTSDAIDIDIFFSQITTIQDVYIQDKNSSLNFIRYNITGTPNLVINNYIEIPVLYTATIPPAQPNGAGNGLTSFGPNHPVIVSFFTNSIEVDLRLTTLETKTQNQTAIPNNTTFNGMLSTSTASPALQLNGSIDGNLYPVNDNLYNIGISTFSYANSEINIMNTKNFLLWNSARTFKTTLTSSNTADASYVMPVTQASTASLLLNDGTGGLSWSSVANYITLLQTQIQSQFIISFSGLTLQTSNGFYPINGFSLIGGANTAVAPSSTTTLTKILKLRLNTSVVADGQRSGYIGTANHPVLYGGAGWNYNFSFGIGDTNAAATSVCQMLVGFSTSLTAPLFSSTLGPNLTPNIFGIGCDFTDTVLHFYMRGTTSGQKIATPFLTSTPSTYSLNLNVYNPVNSNVITLTLTDKIGGLSVSQTFTFSSGSPTSAVLYSSQIYPILCRGMATVGGITNSAQCLFSRFQLTIL